MVRFQSIEESLQKIKALASLLDKRDIYTCFTVLLIAFGAYISGLLSKIGYYEHPVVLDSCVMSSIEEKLTLTPPSTNKVETDTGLFVGSRLSKKYHHKDCPSAPLIKEANRILFSDREEAQRAGYLPAGNCTM